MPGVDEQGNPNPLLAVFIAQARIEAKLDNMLERINDSRHDIETLYQRTNVHGRDIEKLKSSVANAELQQSDMVARGFTTVSIMVAIVSLVISVIFNLL